MVKDYKNQDEAAINIDSIAEQWVNLVFAHLDYKRKNKKIDKKENKNGKQ